MQDLFQSARSAIRAHDLIEGSFAQAANKHHFKRARWRRLWRQQIQDWLIAAVQNIALLCGGTAANVAAKGPNAPKVRSGTSVLVVIGCDAGLYTTSLVCMRHEHYSILAAAA
jgi:hypothetical protein